eukprot:gene20779-26939_t
MLLRGNKRAALSNISINTVANTSSNATSTNVSNQPTKENKRRKSIGTENIQTDENAIVQSTTAPPARDNKRRTRSSFGKENTVVNTTSENAMTQSNAINTSDNITILQIEHRGRKRSLSNENSNKSKSQRLSNVSSKSSKEVTVTEEEKPIVTTATVISTANTISVSESKVEVVDLVNNKDEESTYSSVIFDEEEEEVEEIPYQIKRTIPITHARSDPAQCLYMTDEMYNIYYENEIYYSAEPYLGFQDDLNAKMRCILIDWLVEVHYKSKLQLVGVTALFIASKYEEIYPPEVKDYVYITDYAYDRAEILKMEFDILNALNYEIFVPTGYHFLTRYLNSINASDRVRHLAGYYTERNLQEYEIICCIKPHIFAAAAVYLALIQNRICYYDYNHRDRPAGSVWCKKLEEESGLEEYQLIECSLKIIHNLHIETETASKRKLIAAKKKYTSDKYHNVSKLGIPFL